MGLELSESGLGLSHAEKGVGSAVVLLLSA
jgi:hypothetical protein